MAGAGVSGLALSLFLARQGHRITIYERFDTPRPVGSGLMLQPTGMTVLDVLGLLPAVIARGSRIGRLDGRDARSRRTVLDVRYQALRGGRFGLGIHRASLFDALYTPVVGEAVAVECGREVADVDLAGSHGRLVFADGSTSPRFDLIVDASGAGSPLLNRAAIAPKWRQMPFGALWASLQWPADGFDADRLAQRYDKASVMIGVMPAGRLKPLSGELAAFFWSVRGDRLGELHAGGLQQWKDRVAGYWPRCAPLLDQIDDFEQLAFARYHHHTLRRPYGGGLHGERLIFIGDAAHSTSPQLGQGANMALLDAAALARALERSCGDLDQAVRLYHQARMRHIAAYQFLSWFLTPFYQSDSRAPAWIRDWLVASVAKVPPAPALLAAMVAGLYTGPLAKLDLEEPDWARL